MKTCTTPAPSSCPVIVPITCLPEEWEVYIIIRKSSLKCNNIKGLFVLFGGAENTMHREEIQVAQPINNRRSRKKE